MAGYTPLFATLTTGTLCGKWPDIGLWPIVLSMADRYGIVDVTPDYLCRVTGLQIEAVTACMRRFCEPDPHSRSQEAGGARLRLIDPARPWGWQVVNHRAYREKARKETYDAARVADGRNAERQNHSAQPRSAALTRAHPPSDSNADSDTNKNKKPPSEALVASNRDDRALTVFVHWQREWKHPGTRLDKKRRARIEARLKDFTPEQICDAISGFKHSAWHTGTDPKGHGVVYDALDTLLRDSGQVETGLRYFTSPPRPPPRAETDGDRLLRSLNGDDNSRVIEHDAEYTAITGR